VAQAPHQPLLHGEGGLRFTAACPKHCSQTTPFKVCACAVLGAKCSNWKARSRTSPNGAQHRDQQAVVAPRSNCTRWTFLETSAAVPILRPGRWSICAGGRAARGGRPRPSLGPRPRPPRSAPEVTACGAAACGVRQVGRLGPASSERSPPGVLPAEVLDAEHRAGPRTKELRAELQAVPVPRCCPRGSGRSATSCCPPSCCTSSASWRGSASRQALPMELRRGSRPKVLLVVLLRILGCCPDGGDPRRPVLPRELLRVLGPGHAAVGVLAGRCCASSSEGRPRPGAAHWPEDLPAVPEDVHHTQLDRGPLPGYPLASSSDA
jgi:hypothetical protein